MSYKLSKFEAIEQVKRLRIDDILFYMNDINSTCNTRVKWVNEFIEYLENDYFENLNGLKSCTDEFNTFYWIPKYINERIDK